MNAKRKKKFAFLAVGGALSMFVVGCELLVDFDRTKIPVEGTDAPIEAAPTDAPLDTTPVDAPVDSPVDAADAADAADASDASDAADDADADAGI